MYDDLITKLSAHATIQRAQTGASALRALAQRPAPAAVLLTDEALTQPKNVAVWRAVVDYVRHGGTAIAMGHFPSFVKPKAIQPFFAQAGLPWDSGTYQRTTVALNVELVGAKRASGMPRAYSQKALYVKNVAPEQAWYRTTPESVESSMDHIRG